MALLQVWSYLMFTANRRQLRYQLIYFLILNIILNPKLFHKDKVSIFNIEF